MENDLCEKMPVAKLENNNSPTIAARLGLCLPAILVRGWVDKEAVQRWPGNGESSAPRI